MISESDRTRCDQSTSTVVQIRCVHFVHVVALGGRGSHESPFQRYTYAKPGVKTLRLLRAYEISTILIYYKCCMTTRGKQKLLLRW